MVSKSDIAIVVITYNYKKDKLFYSLKHHSAKIDSIIVVDNSDNYNKQQEIKNVCEQFKNCELISLNENMGIAYALNRGCESAIKKGYKWILTLDQDSLMPYNMIDGYLSVLNTEQINSLYNIGMLTCYMSTWSGIRKISKEIESVELCWTSGALMNLNVYSKVGGFEEKLFIDGVDFDMCAKMLIHGYSILRVNSIVLNHNLGNTQIIKLPGIKHFYVTNHSPLRRYYMTRNGLFLSHKYGNRIKGLKITLRSYLILFAKILLFEKLKRKKLISIFKGTQDYHKDKYGKFNE